MADASGPSAAPLPLDDVLTTAELDVRPSRRPDNFRENCALTRLMEAAANPPPSAGISGSQRASYVLQQLAEMALELCQAHSAGISILEQEGGREVFRWRAAAGRWSVHCDETIPRDSPCGIVVDRNAALLMAYPERHFPYSPDIALPIAEALLIPFHVAEGPVGTIWVIAHDDTRRFDAEDRRLLMSLGRFAANTCRLLDRERLDGRLPAMQKLQDTSTQLIQEDNVELLYEQLVDAAVAIMHSDFASMQMLYPERGEGGELRLLAFRGFNPEAARFWEWVRADSGSSCAAALRSGTRVIVPDIEDSELMAGTDDLETYRQTGIRAVQTTPLLSRSGKLLGMISTHWRNPHLPPASDLGLFDVLARQAADLIERAITDAALRDSEQRMRQFSDASPDIIWIRDAETLRYEFVSPAFDRIYGVDRARLSDYADLWLSLVLPEDREEALTSLARVARGESVVYEFRARRLSDGRIRVIRNTTFPLRDGGGRVQRIGGFGQDITEQRAAEEQTKLLLLEVNHRAKNLLAVVRAVARLTAEDEPATFVERFSARLAGLAASQELLVRAEWRGVEMDALVRSQLSHFQDLIGSRIRLDGAPLRLSPAAAQTIGMALHELATNAGKYGVLSNDTGTVAVSWQRTNGPESQFRMTWHERGGPPVVPPAHQGFGYTVMVSMVEYALDASVSLRGDPAGVSWEISAPAAAVFESAPEGAQ